MTPEEQRAFELAVLEDAHQAVMGDFESIRSVASMMRDDLIEMGYPEWKAQERAQEVLDEYFSTMARAWRRIHAGEVDGAPGPLGS
ncbi:MAG TPA: hypothetical protein VNC22_23255 [Sporichthya sp.]|jgi:hypothetical protein|nr:hypothetical protein [Sporichthya sp.]